MPVEPKMILVDNAGLYIEWDDGHRSTFPHRHLRLCCRCAGCIDEWTQRPVLDPNQVPADVAVLDHLIVGNYALQFLFSDEHYTGIYPYELLRAICACADCRVLHKEAQA